MKFLKILVLWLFIFGESSGINLIRDAEIETVLTDMVKPIFKVAGLKEKSAKVFVVNSDTINAFTIGNGYIFINYGLLLRIKDPLQLIAVLSHETGHIAAGHIVRLMAGLSMRSRNNAVALIAGLLVGIFTGMDKGLAASLGYIMADERMFLRYSRNEEMAADSLGVSYLEKMGYDPECMIGLFQVFQNDSVLNGGEYFPEFAGTHPDSRSRMNFIKNRAKKLSNLKKQVSAELVTKYQRICNKIRSFIKNRNLPKDEYSRAIYLHRVGRVKESVEILEKLSKENPKDIFYKESLAHFLYESGDLARAIAIYKKIDRKDINPLIRKDYAEVLLEANQDIDKALRILQSIKDDELLDSNVYRLLAKGYGKKNKIGIANLMLAQEQLFIGNYDLAEKLLDCCLKQLNKKTEKSYIQKAEYLKDLIKRNRRY